MPPLLERSPRGLYCAEGDFFIDPSRRVDRAIVTHAHTDHARAGSRSYICAASGEGVLRLRIGRKASIQPRAFGESFRVGGVNVSLHPAGHILGSAQVRIERGGEVWVVSGDYKSEPDRTAETFEPQRCHTFITECTFGRPEYIWPPQADVFAEINDWWRDNRRRERCTVLCGYSLGKAQRLLAGADPSIGPIMVHREIVPYVEAYRAAGVTFPEFRPASADKARECGGTPLIIAPPAALRNGWLRPFRHVVTGYASGWMLLRGAAKRFGVDRGFVLSDHVDWPSLHAAIDATGAERIGLMHGDTQAMQDHLAARGRAAWTVDDSPRRSNRRATRRDPPGQLSFEFAAH